MIGWKEKIHMTVAGYISHVVFKCPNCGYKIRAPRGCGIICIKCPGCRIEFSKKT